MFGNLYWQDGKKFLWLMFPILITQLAQSGMGLIDVVMAGRISALDLAGVSIGAGIWIPILLLGNGILMATTPLLGEAIGQKQMGLIAQITQQSLWLSQMVAMVGMVSLNVIPLAFDYLAVPSNIQPIAKDYLFGVSLGLPAVSAYVSLRSYTETLKQPMIVTVMSLVGLGLNVPINYLFMYGLQFGDLQMIQPMGGAGCGYATAVIMWLNLLGLGLFLAFSKRNVFVQHRFYRQFTKPKRQIIVKLLTVGLPIGITIFFEASLFSLAALVISPLGEVAVSSHQVTMSITSQIFTIPLSMAITLTIMVSYCFGAKDWLGFKRICLIGLGFTTIVAIFSTFGIFMFQETLPTFFSHHQAVIDQAVVLLWFAMAYQIVDAWQVCFAGILRGIQDTKVPMWLTLFCYWLVALPLGTYLVRFTDMGNRGFWVALVLGLGLAAILLGGRLWQQQKHLANQWQKI